MKTQKEKWHKVIELAEQVDKIASEEKVTINGIRINGLCAVMGQGYYESGEYVQFDELDKDMIDEVDAIQITIDDENNGDYIRIEKSDIEQALGMLGRLAA